MKLREYLFRERISQAKLARDLNISASYCWRITQGDLIPSNKLIRNIEKLTGGKVTFRDFFEEDEDKSRSG